MKTKKMILLIAIIYIINLLLTLQIIAEQENPQTIAEFQLIYKSGDKSYIVNDAVLPEMLGENLPYILYCNNLSKGAQTFEWFIKAPGKNYELFDNTPNPKLEISNYGPTYIKLRINGSDIFIKEHCVTANEYGFETKLEKIISKESIGSTLEHSVKNTSTYISPNGEIPIISDLIKPDINYKGSADFKISYLKDNTFYNITDDTTPFTVEQLPFKVILTNTSKVHTDFVWFIKFPGKKDYIWMDNVQNATATIWQYGTITFKLVLNGDAKTAKEYIIKVFPSEQKAEMEEALKSNNQKHRSTIPKFQIIYSSNNTKYDVTNSSIPYSINQLPYEISFVNITKNFKTYDWSIKLPGVKDYQPLNDFKVTIKNYGPVWVKLRIDGKDFSALENKVFTFFSNENSDISNYGNQFPVSVENAKADFKILSKKNDKYSDVTDTIYIKDDKELQETFYLNNLSLGNEKDEWFIKFEGQEYVPFDTLPNPIANVWKFGKVGFKLCINGDKSNYKERFIKIFSTNDTPTILLPEKNSRIDIGDISLNWKRSDNISDYMVTLTNLTKNLDILKEKRVKGESTEFIPKGLLEEGCKYSLKVLGVESHLFDTSVFYINGSLNLNKKPVEVNNVPESAVIIESNKNVNSALTRTFPVEYFAFNIERNSNMSLILRSIQTQELAVDIMDSNYNIVGKLRQNKEEEIQFTKVARAGLYYLKIFSNGNLSDVPKAYEFSLKNKIYNPKTLLLYVGYGFRNDKFGKFPEYSDEDLDKIFGIGKKSINTNDFLILNGNQSSYGVHQAIPKDKQEEILEGIQIVEDPDGSVKEKMKEELRGSLDEYITKDGEKQKNPSFVPMNRTMESFVEDAYQMALRLIKRDPNVNLWFSIPSPIGATVAEHYTKAYKENLIHVLKSKLNEYNPDIWRNNVVGFYYSLEAIPTQHLTFDIKDKSYIKTNPTVSSMKSVSDIIHNEENKLFMWIPYLGISPENVKKIGHVANNTDIFDYVLLQPNRIFDGSDFLSNGTGDQEIEISNRTLGSEKYTNVNVNLDCKLAQSMKVKVLDENNRLVSQKEYNNLRQVEFSFLAWRGLYTVIVWAKEGEINKIYSKALYVEQAPTCSYNIPAVLKSVKKNSVYYTGSNGLDGEKVVEKTSRTRIGFEMEIDSYFKVKPEEIDFSEISNDFVANVMGSVDWSKEEKESVIKARSDELNKYYRTIIIQKNARYNEYVKAFKNVKRNRPMAFYVGEKNELMRSINFGITSFSRNVFDAVSKFWGK